MKKVFFLTNAVDLANSSDGLAKKIHAQTKAFKDCGYVTELAGCSGDFYKIGEYQFSIQEAGVFKKTDKTLDHVEKYLLSQESYEILYIRKFYFTPRFLTFLKNIRQKFKSILLELPTYPYYGELQTTKAKIGFWIEHFLVIKKLHKYIDKIVTFSSDKKIYGIDCIKISNGIDASEQIYFEEPSRDIIHFISVSSISFWHGIDRFILALKDYPESNVHFHVVGGENDITVSLKKMVDEYHLKDKVTFHGHKNGNALKDIYAMSHIGVGSLGRHRSNIYYLNSLKNREYIAKGLPIVYSEIDDGLENLSYIYKATPNEEPIVISDIVSWFKTLDINRMEVLRYSDIFLWKNQIDVILKNIYISFKEEG